MRYLRLKTVQTAALATVLVFANGSALAADMAKRTVYLNHLVLEELKTTNPKHYAQARQAMAAAAELCKPGAPRILEVEGAVDVSCTQAFLKTSNPPKREISFTLDEVHYIALVTMKDAAPTFHPAGQDAPSVVKPAK